MRIIVRGGGDLGSGVVARLHRAGWQVIVTELAQPLAVRRYVSFAETVYAGEMQVEEIKARRVATLDEARAALAERIVPVFVSGSLEPLRDFHAHVLVDGRMRKHPPETGKDFAPLVIGLGPGFTAGVDCHAVVETNRGPFLGRVIWNGTAQADTGIPEKVGGFRAERVLRAPVEGQLESAVEIGTMIKKGELVARVNDEPILAPFDGVLRGLVHDGLRVRQGEKVGDVDPRGDPRLCWMISDKALAVGGGVIEAILACEPLRKAAWED